MSKCTYDQNKTAYQLKGNKHTCPSCGKHTLQLYVGVADGEPINDQVGKCDRHYNCGYDYTPKAYFADNPDELPQVNGLKRTIQPRQEAQKRLTIIPKEYVVKSIIPAPKNGLCGFVDILLQMFNPADIERVIKQYYLGYTKLGAVIFWQIDEKGLTHEGKVMKYDVHTGGRNKASWATGESYWIFGILQARGVLPKNTSSTKCIFGQHLLRNADAKTNVMITESEKNAIYGALAMPNYMWLAVGSSQDINKLWQVKDKLARCRSVVVIPDADAINDWRKKIKDLDLPNIKVSNLCAGHAGGWDIADVIRDMYVQHPHTFTPATPKAVEPPKVRKCRIIRVSLFPEEYDYIGIYDNSQLPPDFFKMRPGAAPF